MSSKRTGSLRNSRWYGEEEWRAAYDRAAAELGLPPMGRRSSPQNRVRRMMRARVSVRAMQLLWLTRAELRAPLIERYIEEKGRGAHAG